MLTGIADSVKKGPKRLFSTPFYMFFGIFEDFSKVKIQKQNEIREHHFSHIGPKGANKKNYVPCSDKWHYDKTDWHTIVVLFAEIILISSVKYAIVKKRRWLQS